MPGRHCRRSRPKLAAVLLVIQSPAVVDYRPPCPRVHGVHRKLPCDYPTRPPRPLPRHSVIHRYYPRWNNIANLPCLVVSNCTEGRVMNAGVPIYEYCFVIPHTRAFFLTHSMFQCVAFCLSFPFLVRFGLETYHHQQHSTITR